MKHFAIALLMSVILPAQARILTVSNMSFSPGQYTTFNLAMAAAVDGDIIYVHGSIINYGPITINRSGIVVIGTGHDPQKQFPFVTMFSTIDVIGDNCQLLGIVAERVTVIGPQPRFTMKRCKILGSPSSPGVTLPPVANKNYLLESNVFTGATGVSTNIRVTVVTGDIIIIRNNIFSGPIDGGFGVVPNTLQIVNNIFLRGPTAFPAGINWATINNNIFYGSSPTVSPSSTLTMNNNISFNCPSNIFATGPTITSVNNLTNVNPQFVNYPGGLVVYNYLHDYHLAPGSPGLLTGSDGTDRGVYGGFGTIFNMEGEPAIAEITSVTITSPTTVPPGGTLNITVTSKRVH
jgi:hypothetical protein